MKLFLQQINMQIRRQSKQNVSLKIVGGIHPILLEPGKNKKEVAQGCGLPQDVHHTPEVSFLYVWVLDQDSHPKFPGSWCCGLLQNI